MSTKCFHKVSLYIQSRMNVEDSLDNLSALHLNQQRSLLVQIKQKFVIALQKLQSSQTREIGISELRKLIDQYRQPEHLRNYIAILKTLKPSPNSATKEHEILVISILASTFRTQLLDPLDKPPSVLKTAFRLVEVLHGYFADRSATVQQACARALLDLCNFCLSNQETDTIFSIVYSPLVSILKSGVDKGSQATAAACLNELISNCRRVGNNQMLGKLSADLLAVILKVNCEYHQLFQAVSSMLEVQGLAFLQTKLVPFLAKILAVISGTRDAPNSGSLNSYMCKVHVCKIVERLGVLLPAQEKDKLVDLGIQESLVLASRNRIMQVQLAAARALRAWRGEAVLSPPKNGLASLEEKRNGKLRERSRSKDEQEKLEKELTYMKEDLEKLVKGGWGANNRAKNYVKRGSGVGGGSHGKGELSPPSRSGGKSHKEHFEELREYIKKGAEENRNIDRFALPNLDQKRGKSPPRREAKEVKEAKEAKPKRQQQFQEPQLQVDEGDQMVFESVKRTFPNKNRNSRLLKEAGISEAEADELVTHEKSLMNEGKDVNFYTEKSRSRKDSKDSRDSLEKQPQKQQLSIPLAPNQLPKNAQPSPKNSRILSQEQIGDLVEEYNLSQVSQNLDGILNESDLRLMEETTPPSSLDNGRSGLQEIREKQAEKRARQSIVDKFFRKEKQERQEDSQQQKPESPQQQYQTAFPKPSPAGNQPAASQAIANSLNFTESAVSRNRSREEIQFTLNPKDRFSSLRPTSHEQKQIQQQIVMSEYQDSVPKGQLPAFKPSARQPAPESLAQYQQLIKNPPKRQQRQQSAASRSERDNSQCHLPEEQVDLGREWLGIVALMQKGSVNEAFQAALSLDDPIYLLRLMLVSKCPLRKLTAQTVQALWGKFLQIYSARFIDVLTVGLLGEANQLGLLTRCLSLEELEGALVSLYELSGASRGRLSYSAASLYNAIERSLHPS